MCFFMQWLCFILEVTAPPWTAVILHNWHMVKANLSQHFARRLLIWKLSKNTCGTVPPFCSMQRFSTSGALLLPGIPPSWLYHQHETCRMDSTKHAWHHKIAHMTPTTSWTSLLTSVLEDDWRGCQITHYSKVIPLNTWLVFIMT